MDLNVPLEAMGGKTALDVAKAAYKEHKSQQWCWFYVSDTYKYSCADFGLYKTSVGVDENNSMLEHLVLYAEQERLAEETRKEQERLERERLEREKAEAAEYCGAGLAVLLRPREEGCTMEEIKALIDGMRR